MRIDQRIHIQIVFVFSLICIVDANSRMGVDPGKKNSSDTDGLVKQPYTSRKPSGGFLPVKVECDRENMASLRFHYFDEVGKLLHQVVKQRAME